MMNHNDFPKMTEEFDRSVRRALDSLPERESKPVRRFSSKKIVCTGLAAALCIGGTAFAANAQSWFPLLFPNGGDANLERVCTDGGQHQADRRERQLPPVRRIRAV